MKFDINIQHIYVQLFDSFLIILYFSKTRWKTSVMCNDLSAKFCFEIIESSFILFS